MPNFGNCLSSDGNPAKSYKIMAGKLSGEFHSICSSMHNGSIRNMHILTTMHYGNQMDKESKIFFSFDYSIVL